MRLTSLKEEKESKGRLICIYSDIGVGKTVTTIQTAPDPIMYIRSEVRSLKPAIEAANRENLKIKIATYQGFEDAIEFLSNLDNFTPFTTVFLDSLSHLMNISLADEIVAEKVEDSDDKKVKAQPLHAKGKVTLPDQGALNRNIFRLLNCLMTIAVTGDKIVVVSCRMKENPKYRPDLIGAPNLSGREVPDNFGGFFDLVGVLKPRITEDNHIVYPPHISFNSTEYLTKFTGIGKTEGVYNLSKILNYDSQPSNQNQEVTNNG
jgi:hypothetical protein